MFTLIVTEFEGIVAKDMMITIVLFTGMSFPTKSQMNQETTLI
jgi:hypothetical protein